MTSNLEEISNETDVCEMVQDLASQKAQAVFEIVKDKFSNPVVLGSDTIVVLDNCVMGKPKDRNEAKEMLLKLKGKTHRVLTGVSIIKDGGHCTFFDETKVTFENMSDSLLEYYLDTGESLDKAGAYGIQGAALGFIEKVEGSYSNVVGLPVNLVLKKLISFLELDEETNWREQFED